MLRELGFSRNSGERHWSIPGTEVFLELPDRRLEPDGAQVELVELANGRTVRVLSQIDVLLGRVLELTLGPQDDVTLQALALLPGITDRAGLMERARQIDEVQKVTSVTALLERLVPVADQLADGTRAALDHDFLYRLVMGQ